MLTAVIIWLIGTLGGLQVLFGLTGGALCCGMLVRAIVNYEHKRTVVDSLFKKMGVVAFILFTLCSAIPSEKTAYLMVAGYIAQETITSDTGQKLVQVVNIELDKIIKEGLKNGN